MFTPALGRLVLAAVIGSAGVAKLLRPPSGGDRHAVDGRPMLAAVGVAELALGGLLLADRTSTVPLLAAGAFLVAATAYLSSRLVVAYDTECSCWGIPTEARSSSELRNALRPAFHGLRNSGLLALVWLLLSSATGQSGSAAAAAFYGSLTVTIMMAAGLLASIVRYARHVETGGSAATRAHYRHRIARLVVRLPGSGWDDSQRQRVKDRLMIASGRHARR